MTERCPNLLAISNRDFDTTFQEIQRRFGCNFAEQSALAIANRERFHCDAIAIL